jgi:hypothetical protein
MQKKWMDYPNSFREGQAEQDENKKDIPLPNLRGILR